MCVCISCFKQFDLLFCWILKKVLLQLRLNCKMRSQAAAAEALRVAEECRRKEKEVGMGRMEDVIRCHHIYIYILESLECGALDNPNLGSIQSKQAQEVAKKIGVCKPN